MPIFAAGDGLSLLPTGILHVVENNAISTIACRGVVHLNIWMYENSKFNLEEGFAVFGLHAAVYNETSLSIEKDCLIADDVHMRTSDHHSIIDLDTMKQVNFPADIRIEQRVRLGEGATILKGTTIGAGSVISARALVTRPVPGKELWGGVPARPIRRNVSWVASHPANPYDVDMMARALAQPDLA